MSKAMMLAGTAALAIPLVSAHAAPIPVISYLFDDNTTPQYGSVTGTRLGAGSTNNLPQYSSNTPLAYAGNKSLHFDGASASADDRVTIGAQAIGQAISGQGAVTFAAWVNYQTPLDAGQYDNVIFSSYRGQESSSGNASGLWASVRGDGVNAGKLLIGANAGGGFKEAYSTAALSANEWHFVVGIYDFANSQIRISVDGAALTSTAAAFGSTTYVNDPTPSANQDKISDATTRVWPGYIDEFAIFNGALSQDDITYLHQNGLSDIPEPSSAGIITSGIAVLLGARQRRSN